MQFLITFLEGLISFISPCMLPLLPIYVSYFAGDAQKSKDLLFGGGEQIQEEPAPKRQSNVLWRSIAFVLGFSVVFCLLGVFAGTLGMVLLQHQTVVNIVCGALVILFGLAYLKVIPLPLFKSIHNGRKITGIVSAFVFGVVYSVTLSPCIGVYLGSALLLASSAASALQGVLLLAVYSLGLGIPFVLSALLLEKLGGAFEFIQKHYDVINIVCGVFLILVGIAMMFGWLNGLLLLGL